MASLYITEFSSASLMPAFPAITTQKITTSGTTAQSAALNTATRSVRIVGTGIVSIVMGTNPTATLGDTRLSLGEAITVGVPTGQVWKIAVIDNT